MRRIAIIPARSGSKGLADKNIRMIYGKPLMAWTIEAAVKSQLFDIVVVSTDSAKYKQIAEEYGARVPFFRSEANSTDTASSWETVREVLNNYSALLDLEFDVYCLLQPTSPLRTAGDIKRAVEIFDYKRANSVVSVCESEHAMALYNRLNADCSMDGFVDLDKPQRRQDDSKYYRINGAIYIQKTQDIMAQKHICSENSFAYIMNKQNSIDVDDIYDFMMAEALFPDVYDSKS